MQQEHAARTLRYWFDVEALTAPDAEDDTDRSTDHFVTYVRDGVHPWEAMRQPDRPHKHFVRFGIVPRYRYEEELFAALSTPAAPDDDSGRRKASKPFTYLGVFEVDAQGSPQGGTLQMAAFAPAFASLSGRRSLDFVLYQEELAEFFDREVLRRKDEERSADAALIATLLDKTLSLLEWTPRGLDEAPSAIVLSEAVVGEDGKPRYPQLDPVNGFFLDDIYTVIKDVEAGRPCGLVLPYLADPKHDARLDCTEIDAIDRSLAIENLPDGRWPTEFPLTLMQQVAVNEALRRLAPGGLFSINGPPGTGKTTLLMDVVAALVVERAKVLATFERPKDAFTKRWSVKYPNLANPAAVFALDPRLHDFSMVVASSNNGAVENVTRELPNVTKIGPAYRDDARYFASTATALLNLRIEDDADDADGVGRKKLAAWGLISAVLGKKANRMAFTNTITAKSRRGDDEPWNVFRQLRETSEAADWKHARREFQDAVAEVERLKGDIAAAERRLADAAGLRRLVEELEPQIAADEAILEAAGAEVLRTDADLGDRDEEFRAADKDADLRRPSGLVQLLAMFPFALPAFGAARSQVAAFEEAVERRSRCERARNEARMAAKAARATAETAARALADARRKLREATAALASAAAEPLSRQGIVGFDRFRAASEPDRQQMLPRSSDALGEARARVFLKAMALHLAFIVNSDGRFERNLKRALGMLGGSDPALRPILPEAATDLWATLFLLVPVVSTTFASFARAFADVPRGGIAWLFVDEAGQAVPQHAVGALARAKRALIVGDPLQVEPVITLDENVDRKLAERHGVSLRYLSTSTSLQALADQVNPFGTYLSSHTGEPVWVGSPLKVHRRCVDPMFSIANRIAYNGTMVLGRGKAEQEAQLTDGDAEKGRAARPLLGPSRWIDVKGTEGCENHFIPAQADIALAIVRAYVANGWLDEERANGLPDLFIISPFRSAAAGMRDRLRRTRRDWAAHLAPKEVEAWLTRSVGTVHTFQGKEAESVILLLGGKTPGAVKWAASTPNILNVAVTRAQRRLYVVGDWNEWMKWPLVRSTMDIDGWRLGRDAALALIETAMGDPMRRQSVSDADLTRGARRSGRAR